jgi:hypothetical protein
MRILAIDAGATSGWAYYDKGVLVSHGNIKDHDLENGNLDALPEPLEVDYMVVEENMWGISHNVTWRQGLMVGMWQVHFPGRYVGVTANKWRALAFDITKPMVRKEAKLRARKHVEALGLEVKCEDEVEAIVIGSVGERIVNQFLKGKLCRKK